MRSFSFYGGLKKGEYSPTQRRLLAGSSRQSSTCVRRPVDAVRAVADGQPGGGRRGGRRGPPVAGHGVPHVAHRAVPAAVQDAARVVPLRLRRQRDRR